MVRVDLIVWHTTAYAVLMISIAFTRTFIQQVRSYWHRNNGVNFPFFQRFFDQTQNERQRSLFAERYWHRSSAAGRDIDSPMMGPGADGISNRPKGGIWLI